MIYPYIMMKPSYRLVSNIPPLKDGQSKTYDDMTAQQFLEARSGDFNCHFGQRKLLFALLEFLTLCAQKFTKTLGDCLLVYVGAAPGWNIEIVSRMFPELSMELYDPRRIDCKTSGKVHVHKKCFTDACAVELQEIGKNLNKSYVLFMSDIRTTVDETLIAQDMKLQAKWARSCKAAAVSLKFRLPYERDTVTYMAGKVYLQLYAPVRSAEARLIAFARGGHLPDKVYDVRDHDQRMHAFNLYWRKQPVKHPGAVVLSQRFPNLYLNNYETAVEYDIAAMYISTADHQAKFQKVLELLMWLNKECRRVTHQSLQGCHERSEKTFAAKYKLTLEPY